MRAEGAPHLPDAGPEHASGDAADNARCLSDIEYLARLAPTWDGLDPTAIVGSVLDTLLDMLDLDFVGLRFADSAHVFLRVNAAFGAEQPFDSILGMVNRELDAGDGNRLATCSIRGVTVGVLLRPLGAVHSLGTFILGSRRTDFPSRNDLLRLDVAAVQAGLACREVREISDRAPPPDDRVEKPMGDALAESEWRLNLIINSIPALVWSTTADGMLEFCNRSLLDYVGRSFEEIEGLSFYPIFHPDDVQTILAAWQDIMVSKRGREVEGRVRRGDGEFRWFTMRQQPLLDADGNVIRWYGVFTDIEDRKRAEQALEQARADLLASEENLRLIIDSLPVLIWSARPDGSADFINRNWLDYAGLPAEDLLGWGFTKLFHPEDAARMLAIWDRDLVASEQTKLKGRIRGADGRYRWFLFSGRKITEANGLVRWYGINVDIEDLERAEIALRESEMALKESERRLNLIIHTIPAMAWSARPNGMLDFWNQHFAEYVGLPTEQVRGFGFYQIFHPDDLELMRDSWEETLATKIPKEVDGRIRRADGEYRWFTLRQSPLLDADGNVVRWFGVVFEIEDRKRAEIELREARNALLANEARLNQIISSIPGLAWSSDANGATTFWSQRYLDYAGLGIEEVVGFGFISQFHPDDRDHLMEVWANTLKSALTGEAEGRLRGADGQYRWFLIRASPFFDADGNLTQWFGVNIDIDDRKRAEEQLRQSQSDLAHVTRVMTMGELAVSIAHEINQPLMAIVTNAGTCLRWLDTAQLDIQMARKAAERIVRDGHRAGDIVASIRALAQKSVPRMEPIDLGAVVEGVIDLLRGELQRRRIVFETDLACGGTTVIGDPTQLQQVVLNLVMNGAEAMTQVDEASRRIVLRADIAGESARICVLDTGTGLSRETRESMFEAFYSTKPKGIGMGLAICRSIAEAHGGRIWASDNAPQGSVFTFTLPLAGKPQLVAPDSMERVMTGNQAVAERIVGIIDDDESVREALGGLFQSVGLGTECYGSVHAFLEADALRRVGCIVLDIRLPGQSGLEFQEALSRSEVAQSVVLISAHVDVQMAVRAMKCGAVDVLPKPVREQDLLEAVNRALDRDRDRRLAANRNAALCARYATLTERERQVMGLVAAGMLNKQIADRVNVTEATVKLHRSQVMRKMEADSVPDLVRMSDRLAEVEKAARI